MSKKSIDQLFKEHENDFDIETPESNHTERFLHKLNKQSGLQSIKVGKQRRRLWKPLIGVAASVILLITLFIGSQQETNYRELASVSPKMAETEDFFTSTIAEELSKIKNENSPKAQALIQDTMARIKVLEKDYESLKIDLTVSGDDRRVIYAMISNFQNRIDILQNALEQIEKIKQLNNRSHEMPNINI
ncbi:hypothetical protein [Flavivirga rizhaonensis]|uniref:DUF4179 domain-containing protein n=1 Tax=Flavivirga rizhaonensis TaxID=2559571 RepID=A0A4S1DZ87_9FLAO|nr:hypothetical protein [Flavivirga rizhaonensis]TGV03325.1 hypothetical protein EM932_06515 [Flavivirga rizhaonensis]